VGKRKKKNRNLGPRRKRMRRPARLMAAPTWLPTYGGKDIVRGYARWYAVDRICAIIELRMLGVAVPAEYEAQVRLTIASIGKARAKRAAERLAASTRPVEPVWEAWPGEWISTLEDDETGNNEAWF
jgi:hypothetical protein